MSSSNVKEEILGVTQKIR